MGVIGGTLGYHILKRYWPGGMGIPMGQDDTYASRGLSKLKTVLGPGIFEDLRDKVVLDFGCGEGANAIELAQNGCPHVIGIDIQEHYLETAKNRAEALGVHGHCTFTTHWSQPVDAIISTDAFEHFEKPLEILASMRSLIKPDGCLLVSFGPIWHHPYGGHLFSVFPWAHLVFTEGALIRWRSDFKTDGATRFHEVAGGLNKMTIKRWEALVAESGFKAVSYELVPIRPARRLHCRLTREWLTSLVRSRLEPA